MQEEIWETRDYYDTSKCARCGKAIPENAFCIKMTQSDSFRGTKVAYWCKKCYNEFKKDLEG